jgi:hypothetical protein
VTAAVRRLPRRDWADLVCLLGLLDDWLLITEPSTVRELGAFLQSQGHATPASEVLRRLSELRTVVGRSGIPG